MRRFQSYIPAIAISALLSSGCAPALLVSTSGSVPEFRVEPVAEREVTRLPAGQLYWRLESTSAPITAATVGEGLSLSTEADDRTWLFTLGPRGARTPGLRLEAEIGPVPIPEAEVWTIRVNRAGGAPGARTPVHAHPGSEAFFVRSGRLCQRTSHGDSALEAGEAMNGHEPGSAMQLTSCGVVALDQWVMFVLDRSRPFSTPAAFP